MKELQSEYRAAKEKARGLMQRGNISGHIAALVRVQELHLQLINMALTPGK